jgi:hypothetical protein
LSLHLGWVCERLSAIFKPQGTFVTDEKGKKEKTKGSKQKKMYN